MILYIIASIGFFLFSIISIFRLVNLWQKNGYNYARLRLYQRQKRKHFYIQFLPLVLSIFIIGVYGFVIINEGFTIWYQFGVTVLFFIKAILAFRNWRRSLKNIQITFTAVTVTVLSLATLIVLYLFPLLDQFVWMLLITLFLPLIVAAFVGFFAFPTELISDFLMQRAKRKLEKFPQIKVVLLEGGSEMNQLKQYLLQLLLPYFTIVTNTTQANTPYSLAKIIRKRVDKNTNIVIFTIQIENKDAVDRLVGMLHPDIFILNDIPKTFANHPKDKSRFLTMHKYFINSLPRNSIVLMNGENENLLTLAKQIKKAVIFYGTEENAEHKRFAIVSVNVDMRKDSIWFGLRIGRKKTVYKIRLHTKKELLTTLPAIFLGYIFHIPENELVQLAKQLGSRRKKQVTSQKNGRK